MDGVGPNQLKLTGDVLANIFMGKITKWNDPQITKLNPGLKLSDVEITVIHRADGSGTTWIFTNYLDKVSKAWHDKVGSDTSVNWPVGLGGKGNEGVASYVKQVPGAIGYVEYAYAKQNKMATVQLQNKDGEFVNPTMAAFQAAAANADWSKADHFYVVLTDQPGKESWPIAGRRSSSSTRTRPAWTRPRPCSRTSTGAIARAASWPRTWTTSPCRRTSWTLVEATWKREVTSGGKPVWDGSLAAK